MVTRTIRNIAVRKLTILFVDNDCGAQARIQRALDDAFTLQCVSSVEEAKEFLDEFVPDLLISEVALGQESGLELCRYVRDTPVLLHIPIMLLTSLSTLSDKVAGFAAGTDDYVVKPFDTRHLQARIRLLFRIKRMESRLHV
jgi:DNA-binding response OmpR family regulator